MLNFTAHYQKSDRGRAERKRKADADMQEFTRQLLENTDDVTEVSAGASRFAVGGGFRLLRDDTMPGDEIAADDVPDAPDASSFAEGGGFLLAADMCEYSL